MRRCVVVKLFDITKHTWLLGAAMVIPSVAPGVASILFAFVVQVISKSYMTSTFARFSHPVEDCMFDLAADC